MRPLRTFTRPVPAALVLLLGLVALVASAPRPASAVPASYVYWSDGTAGKIQRADPDGSNVIDVVTGVPGVGDLAVDWKGQMVYWANTNGKVQRAPLASGTPEDIVTGLNVVNDLALDLANGKVYWADNTDGKVQRANLDGSAVEDVVLLLTWPTIAVDSASGKLYYSTLDEIWRANLNGSGATQVASTSEFAVMNIAFDAAGNKIYWAGYTPAFMAPSCGHGSIGRATPGGPGEGLASTNNVRSIAVDAGGGRVYWADNAAPCGPPPPVGEPKIVSANLDGSDAVDVNTSISSGDGVALGGPQPVGGVTELSDVASGGTDAPWLVAVALATVGVIAAVLLGRRSARA